MLAFRIELAPDDNGTVLATCPDLPEVTTFGEDEADALLRAVDAIEEALAARMARRQDIPLPSKGKGPRATLSTQAAVKVALYRLMNEEGLRKADLARRLCLHAPQVDRLLDLRHATRLDQLDAAFHALGKQLDVRVE